MNLNQLRFARAVAATESFSRAAESCFVTQPTLSNAINQLEEELGGRLFHRTTRNVGLTPFGKHLLPLIEGVLDAQSELVAAAKAFHEPQHRLIRIGLSPLIDVRLLSQMLTGYTAQHPEVEIFFKQCFLSDMAMRLENGTVDIAIIPAVMPAGGRERFTLYREPLCFLPREADGVAPLTPGMCDLKNQSAEAIILTSGCGLSDAIGELYQRKGLTLRPYPGQALNYQVVEDWAGLGIAAGILPRSKVSHGNRSARPIAGEDGRPAEVSYEVQWAFEATRVPHVAGFIAHLRSLAATAQPASVA